MLLIPSTTISPVRTIVGQEQLLIIIFLLQRRVMVKAEFYHVVVVQQGIQRKKIRLQFHAQEERRNGTHVCKIVQVAVIAHLIRRGRLQVQGMRRR